MFKQQIARPRNAGLLCGRDARKLVGFESFDPDRSRVDVNEATHADSVDVDQPSNRYFLFIAQCRCISPGKTQIQRTPLLAIAVLQRPSASSLGWELLAPR